MGILDQKVKKWDVHKETIRVKAQGVPNLICTPNHNIWSRDRKLGTRAKILTSVPQWSEAKDLLGKYVNQKMPPDRKSTRLNSSHITRSRMPSSA